jgi:hypothetical protein
MVTTTSGARDEVWISVQFPLREKSTIGDKRTTETVIDGFLLDHLAKLEPEGDGWLLRYPLASSDFHEKHLVEAKLRIVGETREDALMIAKLILRSHEPPKILAESRQAVSSCFMPGFDPEWAS